MWETLKFNANIHVINEEKRIYKIVSTEERMCSDDIILSFNLELVAGYEYINADESNAQGYVSKEAFLENVQWDSFTVSPLTESLGGRLEEEGYKVVNIKDYKIHQYQEA